MAVTVGSSLEGGAEVMEMRAGGALATVTGAEMGAEKLAVDTSEAAGIGVEVTAFTKLDVKRDGYDELKDIRAGSPAAAAEFTEMMAGLCW